MVTSHMRLRVFPQVKMRARRMVNETHKECIKNAFSKLTHIQKNV